LTLFLVGTVIVLSSVSYYLALPASAFLDEQEVGWNPQDAIKPLKYRPDATAISHRRAEAYEDWVEGPSEIGEEAAEGDQTVWDVDGEGSGKYWMRKDWDGHVEGTKDWTRLLNVTARSVESSGLPRVL
jgi:hypothetical protein